MRLLPEKQDGGMAGTILVEQVQVRENVLGTRILRHGKTARPPGQPDEPHDAWATEQEDGSWLVDGGMPALELKARLDIEALPDEDKDRYNTVAGLMQTVSGSLMQEGEGVDIAGWHFAVLTLEGRRIEQVRVSRLSDVEPEPEDQSDSN